MSRLNVNSVNPHDGVKISVTASTNGALNISASGDNIGNPLLEVQGSISASGNITASNALFTGDVRIIGESTISASAAGGIFLGDANTDNVYFGADVNSNIIPNTNNTFDLGSDAQEWKDIYVEGVGYIDSLVQDDPAVTNTARGDWNFNDDSATISLKVNSSDGNVGIKVSDPNQEFEVAGRISASAQLSVGGEGSIDGHITGSGNLVISGTAEFLQGITTTHLTASGNISASHLEATHSLGGALKVFGNITASGNISASGTVYANNFQSTGGDVAGINFHDQVTITGDITGSGDLLLSDDIIMASDAAVLSMGAGADFTMTHDGTTGVVLAASPITLDSAAELSLFGTQINIGTDTDVLVDLDSAALDIDASGNITIDGTGTLSIDVTGGASNISSATDGAGEDLTIQITGATDSSLVLSSTGTSDDAIDIKTTAGGINIDSADMITIDAVDEIVVNTTSADGHISLVSAHAAGVAIHLDGDTAAGSIVDIDAGILQANATGVANLTAGGALTLNTTGTAADVIITSAHTAGIAMQLTANAAATSQLVIEAGTMSIDTAGAMTIDSSAGTIAIGGDNRDQAIGIATGGTRTLNLGTNDGTDITTIISKGNQTHTGTFTVGVNDTGHDVKFFGATAGQHLLWDESADELVLAGDSKLSFHDANGGENIIASADGHLEINAGTTLDITAPTVDINASTAINLDGATQFNSTLTVGVNDTGYDVKFFGATSGQFLLWDESTDELILAGDSKLSFHDANGGENIIASADGHLEVNAGTTLDMTAPTVDINASTEFQVDAAVIDLNASAAFSMISADNSLISVTGTTKTLDIDATGALTIDSGTSIAIGTTTDKPVSIDSTTFTLDAAAAVAIDGTTLSLDGTGAVNIDSSGGAIGIGITNHDQPINIGTAGTRTMNIGILDGTDTTTILSYGNETHKGTFTVGVNDTGFDVKFFGASAAHFLLWDESADELVLAGDSKLSFHDAAGGENIIASADGHLEINAGTTLDITAPTVDINVSTELNIDGNVDLNGILDMTQADQTDLTATFESKSADFTAETRTEYIIIKDDGCAVTLPAAHAGARITILIGATITTNTTVITAASGDLIKGYVFMELITAASNNAKTHFAPDGSDDLRITLNGGTQGGFIGDRIELVGISDTEWRVRATLSHTGSAATPFS